MNKAEIFTLKARELKSLGTIGVRHDGDHVSYKMLARHVVGHSRPALVALTFVFFLQRYCDCYSKILKS